MAARRRSILWSPEAATDLADIWSFYREVAGLQAAESRVRAIGNACMTLNEHPLVGRARDEVRPGLRSLLVSPHVVFYRVNEGIPQIIRILDGRRDFEEIFSDG
jgi:toxin ParE1/3/4